MDYIQGNILYVLYLILGGLVGFGMNSRLSDKKIKEKDQKIKEMASRLNTYGRLKEAFSNLGYRQPQINT